MENAKKIHLLLHMHRSEFSFFFTNEDAPANLVSYLCFKFGVEWIETEGVREGMTHHSTAQLLSMRDRQTDRQTDRE